MRNEVLSMVLDAELYPLNPKRKHDADAQLYKAWHPAGMVQINGTCMWRCQYR